MRPRRITAVALVVGLTASCAAASSTGETDQLTVFAASSLSGPFEQLGRQFEATHAGTTVRFSFAASSTLAQQIVNGAPADVFAAASPATMHVVTRAGAATGEPAVFVRNRLQIAVPKGNPAGIAGLADLADRRRTIGLCAPTAPCGAAAMAALAAAGVTAAPDTLEPDAKSTLAKVRLGEVDAALVYRTDVIAADRSVDGIDFPQAAGNDYQVAVLRDGAAAAFVAHLRSPAGRAVLSAAGFELP